MFNFFLIRNTVKFIICGFLIKITINKFYSFVKNVYFLCLYVDKIAFIIFVFYLKKKNREIIILLHFL